MDGANFSASAKRPMWQKNGYIDKWFRNDKKKIEKLGRKWESIPPPHLHNNRISPSVTLQNTVKYSPIKNAIKKH